MSGVVEIYDPNKESYLPMPDVIVQLPELGRQTTTDRNGRYSFRNLPAGAFTIVVNGLQWGSIVLGPSPEILRQDILLAPPLPSFAER